MATITLTLYTRSEIKKKKKFSGGKKKKKKKKDPPTRIRTQNYRILSRKRYRLSHGDTLQYSRLKNVFIQGTLAGAFGRYRVYRVNYSLTVSDVHNITLRPYIEKSNVTVDAENMLSLMFKLAFDTVIRDINLLCLRIEFENSINVILTGLNNTVISLLNVFGEVGISHFKCEMSQILNYSSCIVFEWALTQSKYIPNTVVLLHELEVSRATGDFGSSGVYISGDIPGKIILMNSTINNCSWGLNTFVQTSLYSEHTVEIFLHNVSFIDNECAILLDKVENITISNCYFERSSDVGAIHAINSILSFIGNVTFIDNHSSVTGGAISLLEDSLLLIPNPQNTYILFENNTSDDVGGAIYYSSSDIYATWYCKLYAEQIFNKTVLNFSMNTAVNGGNAIYGVYLDAVPCYLPNGTLIQNLSHHILNVSSFFPTDDPSVISSDAEKLCFCTEDGELGDCSWTQLSVYPGQVFGLPVAALGDMNGFVRWQVYANVDEGVLSNELQHSQNTNATNCTSLKYSILSQNYKAAMHFSLSYHSTNDYNTNTHYISNRVDLLDCPLGFNLSAIYGCECHEFLSQHIKDITCNITEQSIQRQGTTWIGVLDSNTSNITLALSNVCPFLYCNKANIKVFVNQSTFINEDIQCTGNRSGVLCGGCRDNFSLALGSNRCLHGCKNNSLSLIIAFAAAGIALVFFIKILNLTVSQGTINGLIFYANIVEAEKTMLFSPKAYYEKFLSVFIAWVNLDLGIETCLFDGMDGYVKAWLQFVFPAYVWSIALFIIIFSHYSICASKLFGNNSVPVLATLILLSYSKLLRAVISALSITDLYFFNDTIMSVWERDGNIQYLTGKHIPLFIFAVAVLVLLWFPFTLVLVSIQWLQKGTHYRVLHWITKLRPFFDAFTGPLKDKHRYWVGALLIVRCSLLLAFYLYTVNRRVAFASIIYVSLLILSVSGFGYRNFYLAVLEISYILNLGILATATLYFENVEKQETLIMTCVGIAFLEFIAIVIYHACVQLREPLRKIRVKVAGMNEQENDNGPERDEYESLTEPVEQPPFQEVSNFREPLLAYIDS